MTVSPARTTDVVSRKATAGRGRGIALHLTAAGAEARTSAHEAIEAFERELAAAFGPSRHARLVKALEEARAIVGELTERRADA